LFTIKEKGEYMLLSVIVPVYNTSEFLRECVDSILGQAYQEIEVLLIDDGSTDDSLEICKEYQAKDARVRVFYKDNEGLSLTRIYGVKRAKGRYVTFVDSDDWVAKEIYLDNMPSDDLVDIVHFGIIRYFSEHSTRCDITAFSGREYDREEIKQEIIPNMLWTKNRNAWGIDPSLCTKIIKKSILEAYFERLSNLSFYYGEDSAVTYPLLLLIDNLVINQNCYYYHRQRNIGINYPYVEDGEFFNHLYTLYNYLYRQFKKSNQWDTLKNQLDHFFLNAVELKRNYLMDLVEEPVVVFPYWKFQKKSKVVLYGAGYLGNRYKELNDMYHFCNIELWIDRKSNKKEISSDNAQSIEMIKSISYDFILIAVQSPILAREITRDLMNMGIPRNKIVWNDVHAVALPNEGKEYVL